MGRLGAGPSAGFTEGNRASLRTWLYKIATKPGWPQRRAAQRAGRPGPPGNGICPQFENRPCTEPRANEGPPAARPFHWDGPSLSRAPPARGAPGGGPAKRAAGRPSRWPSAAALQAAAATASSRPISCGDVLGFPRASGGARCWRWTVPIGQQAALKTRPPARPAEPAAAGRRASAPPRRRLTRRRDATWPSSPAPWGSGPTFGRAGWPLMTDGTVSSPCLRSHFRIRGPRGPLGPVLGPAQFRSGRRFGPSLTNPRAKRAQPAFRGPYLARPGRASPTRRDRALYVSTLAGDRFCAMNPLREQAWAGRSFGLARARSRSRLAARAMGKVLHSAERVLQQSAGCAGGECGGMAGAVEAAGPAGPEPLASRTRRRGTGRGPSTEEPSTSPPLATPPHLDPTQPSPAGPRCRSVRPAPLDRVLTGHPTPRYLARAAAAATERRRPGTKRVRRSPWPGQLAFLPAPAGPARCSAKGKKFRRSPSPGEPPFDWPTGSSLARPPTRTAISTEGPAATPLIGAGRGPPTRRHFGGGPGEYPTEVWNGLHPPGRQSSAIRRATHTSRPAQLHGRRPESAKPGRRVSRTSSRVRRKRTDRDRRPRLCQVRSSSRAGRVRSGARSPLIAARLVRRFGLTLAQHLGSRRFPFFFG